MRGTANMQDTPILNYIDPMKAVNIVNSTLKRIDKRLVDHGERVAYIACRLCEEGNLNLDKKILFLLCSFYDIGAYKTEEIDNMLDFETNNVQNHSIYGYLFMKYFTPLNEYSEAILYHHCSWNEITASDIIYKNYASMIHLADRIDVAFTYSNDYNNILNLIASHKDSFNEEYYTIAKEALEKELIIPQLLDGSFHQKNLDMCSTFQLSAVDSLAYLKMVVYSIDFRSEFTVTHTINTVSIALNIAEHFRLNTTEINDIYFGALLHDIGKISIPLSILESPGKLSDEEMDTMRSHVDETEHLISGIIPDSICKLALRHHEKLDGSGYPKGLTADELTFSQRIIAIADIVSALSSHRSYKDPFPKEKTLRIINEMSERKLDPDICKYVISNYDNIMNSTEQSRIEIIEKYQQIKNEFELLKKETLSDK